ncbi:MAG: hypothetical protein U0W24_09800 [Bacteroidales bacterium]
MKKIIYYQKFILAIFVTISACTLPKTELSDNEKNVIETEVERIVHKIYYEQYPALDYKGTLAFSSKVAFNIEGMSSYDPNDSITEKFYAEYYAKLLKREATVQDLKTEVISLNSAYSTFRLNINDFYKDSEDIRTINAMCTIILTKEADGWKIKHEHLSYQ